MCSIGSVFFFFFLVEMTRPSLNRQYLNSGCVESCHFWGVH